MTKATYKNAGVDLDQYEHAMRRLPQWMHRTFSPRVKQLDGGFAGLFQLDFENPLFARSYDEPVLVACTDGVGTKLKVATAAGVHDTVGMDLVAMCVNDAICCGAEPLFFLDYVALASDDPALLEQIVSGISRGCLDADCALLGGETAIMPDLYPQGEYDLAGFSVGVVEKSKVLDGTAIDHGDLVIGIASSGLHSNGFSLVRKIVFEMAGMSCDDYVEELNSTVSSALLQPTRIYVRLMRAIQRTLVAAAAIHGIAHITGGGLLENVSRIMPEGKRAVIRRDSWTVPPVFSWLQDLGQVDADEMDRVFNRGLGLILIVREDRAAEVMTTIADQGLGSWTIGRVEAGDGAGWA